MTAGQELRPEGKRNGGNAPRKKVESFVHKFVQLRASDGIY